MRQPLPTGQQKIIFLFACWSCNLKIFYIKCSAGSRLAWQNPDNAANLSYPLYSMTVVVRNSYLCQNICPHIIERDGVVSKSRQRRWDTYFSFLYHYHTQDIITYIFLSCVIIIIIAAAGRVIRPAGSSRAADSDNAARRPCRSLSADQRLVLERFLF